ncbi:unnamed protein product [Pedinophyceae sp. YPF-701]|nr:unnamed protein product [Pedinophyceae sp. YPF-701]
MLDHLFKDYQDPRLAKTVAVASAVATGGALAYYFRASVVNAAEWVLIRAQSYGGWPAPSAYLQKGFEPVTEEIFAQELGCKTGNLPSDMQGCFLRNGPNPQFRPTGRYHWFDGDGMLHAVRVKDGRASYCNHFVRTSRLLQEQAAGRPVFLKFGDLRGVLALGHIFVAYLRKALGVATDKDGGGTANTALLCHAQRLLALHEGDLPYHLRVACDGVLDTVGRLQVRGACGKWELAFTAHPKVDPVTGECHFFGYRVDKAPFCVYGAMDAKGQLMFQAPVDIPRGIMMHDFAITEHYAIFLDVPLEFEPRAMVAGGLPFEFVDRPTRIGVVRRGPYAGGSAPEVTWFECPRFMCFHVANAWEEGGHIRLFLCKFDKFTLDLDQYQVLRKTCPEELPTLAEVRLDLKQLGKPNAKAHLPVPLHSAKYATDFPRIHEGLVGRRSRYCYAGCMAIGSSEPFFTGIMKVDLTQPGGPAPSSDPDRHVVATTTYGGRKYGGEPVFVPRKPGAAPSGGNEDDGWVVTYVTDEDTRRSTMNVYSAKDLSAVCSVALPARVPYGFHGMWMTEDQLQSQLAA